MPEQSGQGAPALDPGQLFPPLAVGHKVCCADKYFIFIEDAKPRFSDFEAF